MQTDLVTPAKAGVQRPTSKFRSWIPAFAGMTGLGGGTNV